MPQFNPVACIGSDDIKMETGATGGRGDVEGFGSGHDEHLA